MPNPFIDDGIARLRKYWPQSAYKPGPHGYSLIIVPSVMLPRHFEETICTVLFLAPPGFPCAIPDGFWTDIPLHNKKVCNMNPWSEGAPRGTDLHNRIMDVLFPEWKNSTYWRWKLQAWNPNCDGLFTYMKVIQQRLEINQ